MAIQTRIVNGSYTEIYAGGGNFITQSAPTNFHQFWTQKILTPGETIEDFREVTATEKTALEKSDADWDEPNEEFVSECEAAGVVYNRKTGYFELNGLADITTAQMREIMRDSSGPNYLCDYCHAFSTARTFLPMRNSRGSWGNYSYYAFARCANLEVLDFDNSVYVGISSNSFNSCIKLREIRNGRLIANAQSKDALNLPNLESFTVRVVSDFNLSNASKVTYDSIEYMVSNAINTSPITITLHPEAYARVTDDLFALAAEKNITFATT